MSNEPLAPSSPLLQNPFTNPALHFPPNLPMRGTPESLVIYGNPRSISDYMNDSRVVDTPGVPLTSPETLSTFRRIGRLLSTPQALVFSSFSQTGPGLGEILKQQKDYGFGDLLREKGLDERQSRWWGLAGDIVLDPLNLIGIGALTKPGKAAKVVSRVEKLGPAIKEAFKGLEDVDEIFGLKEVEKAVDSFFIKDGSAVAKQVALARVRGDNLQFGLNWYDQASQAQRSLLTLDVPFTSIRGIPIVPRQISMLALGIPTGLRRLLGAGASKIRLGKADRTLAEVGAALFRRGSGIPLARDIDYMMRNIQKAMEARITAKVANELGPDLAKINSGEWENIWQAFEQRSAYDLAKTGFTQVDLLRAGLKHEVASKGEVQRVLKRFSELMPSVLKSEQAIKLRTSQLGDPLNYVLHFVSEEGLEALKKSKAFELTPRQFTDNHGSMLQRLIKDPIAVANKKAREGKLEILPGVKVQNFFVVDPFSLIVTRMHRASRSMVGALYQRSMAKAFGKEIPEGLAPDKLAKLRSLADELADTAKARRLAGKEAGFLETRLDDALAALRRVTQAGIGTERPPANLVQRERSLNSAIRDAEEAIRIKKDAMRLFTAERDTASRSLKRDLTQGLRTQTQERLERSSSRMKATERALVDARKKLAALMKQRETTRTELGQIKTTLTGRAREAGAAKSGAKRFTEARFRKTGPAVEKFKRLAEKEVRLRDNLKPLRVEARASLQARKDALAQLAEEGYGIPSTSQYLSNHRFKDPAIVQEIDRVFGKFTNVESVADFLQYWDAAQNFWKGITLAPFPAYHARNYVDNIWKNYLAGVSPVSYGYARMALGHFDKLGVPNVDKARLFTTARGEQISLIQFLNEALGLSVVGNNALDAAYFVRNQEREIKLFTEGKVSAFWKNVFNPRASENSFIKFGFDFSRKFIEDPARLAHYIDRRIKGDSAFEAMMSVKKWMFDYEDLSDFERNVLRRVMPFYGFVSNVIPLSIETALTQPGKLNKIFQFERSKIIPDLLGNEDRDLEAKFVEEYIREGAPFFVGQDPDDPDKFRYFMLDGYLSTFEAKRIWDPGDYFLNQLSPLLREPLQQITNWDFFFKKPIVSMPNMSDSMLQKDDFLGMSINRRLVHVLRNIRAFNEADRMIKVASQSPNKATAVVSRTFLGGSRVEVSQNQAYVNMGFRLQQIALRGRKEYMKALKRGRTDEANDILQATLGKLGRGY